MAHTTRFDLDYMLNEVNKQLAPIVLEIHHDAQGYALYRKLDHGVTEIQGVQHGMTAADLWRILVIMVSMSHMMRERDGMGDV